MQKLFSQKRRAPYIPMPKGRGFTPRLVKRCCSLDILPGCYTVLRLHFGIGGERVIHNNVANFITPVDAFILFAVCSL